MATTAIACSFAANMFAPVDTRGPFSLDLSRRPMGGPSSRHFVKKIGREGGVCS